MTAYYNEIDPFAAAWLRELISDGLIADGDVDERSILDVRPNDLTGYDQCHFFAGIGGWSYALRLAGWPDDREVWTGSCPCQPLSSAGQQKGHADERHLWPAFHKLIAECQPATVFGEQVASKLGREWLSGVRADLEDLGYAVGAADIGAASVGAPHIRQRLWWVADSRHVSGRADDAPHRREAGQHLLREGQKSPIDDRDSGAHGGFADSDGGQSIDGGIQRSGEHGQQPQDGGAGGLGNADSGRQPAEVTGGGDASRVADADRARPTALAGDDGKVGSVSEAERQSEHGAALSGRSRADVGLGDTESARLEGLAWNEGQAGVSNSWATGEYIPCADGKARIIEPSIQPLAHGVSARVGKLRGAGNAIVPQVAAVFVRAYDAT